MKRAGPSAGSHPFHFQLAPQHPSSMPQLPGGSVCLSSELRAQLGCSFRRKRDFTPRGQGWSWLVPRTTWLPLQRAVLEQGWRCDPPCSRAWARWALRSGLIGPPWRDTGAGSSVTTAEPRVTMWGNPAPLPAGSPLAAHWVSFPALSHRKSLLIRRRDEAAQGCKASE